MISVECFSLLQSYAFFCKKNVFFRLLIQYGVAMGAKMKNFWKKMRALSVFLLPLRQKLNYK